MGRAIDGRLPRGRCAFDSASGWRHDATAVAVRDGRIVYIGSDSAALAHGDSSTRVINLQRGVMLPGLVDAHTHTAELGAALDRVNLTGIATEAEAVALIVKRAATTPKGEWILGYGWDEARGRIGIPTSDSSRSRWPDHPVILRGLHGFAAWANGAALAKAGITRDTKAPAGGEIRTDAAGEPTGLVLNRAVPLLDDAVPLPSPAQRDTQVLRALHVLADAGYTGVHEAGTTPDVMASLNGSRRWTHSHFVCMP